MRMPRNVLLIALALAVLLIAGCSDSDNADSADEWKELTAFAEGENLVASFTNSHVAGMKGIAQNDHLQLLVDDTTGSIAIIDKQSGDIWFSNPLERETDSVAAGVNKDLLSSQLAIEFYNPYGQSSSMNSYTDSVAYGQISFQRIPEGVRVNYQFGIAKRSVEDLPLMLTKARIDDLSSKLDNTGKRALLIAYRPDAEEQIYHRNDDVLVNMQLERAFKAFEDAGYSDEDLQADMKELGFEQIKAVPRIFLASIEYTLDGDTLVAKIPSSSIQYPSEYPINQISVLSYFGAAGTDEEGSLFVPDGSGALINFNNGKTAYPPYQQSVYGTDRTMDLTDKPTVEQEVRLPVFGILKEKSAVLGIIEDGASVAAIRADVAGRLNSYNYVYPSYIVINKGEVTLNASDQRRTLPKFQEEKVKSDYTVRYAFLSGKDASYYGMAQYYRDYLLDRNGLPQVAAQLQSDNAPFYLQLIGGINKTKHFAGIPYESTESLTTFEQAQSIVNLLQQRGIDDISVKYSGWFNGGLSHKVPEKIKVDGSIGGKTGLQNLSNFAEENNIPFYLDVALVNANSTSGFKPSKDASITLRELPAALYPLDLALNRRDRASSPAYIVSPRLIEGYVDSMLKELTKFKVSGISLRDLADQLNSDYRKNNQIDRAEAEAISIQSLSKLREAGLDIIAEGGNAYALPFLSGITNAPMSNSHFKIEDEGIPFYQLVIRGIIDYTGAPYNLSSYTNSSQYVMKSLEYGANVAFEWVYEPNRKMKDTDFSNLYSVHYGLSLDQATDIYHEVNAFLKTVRGEPILVHEKLGDGVYKTVYGNGLFVIVNYNSSPVTVDGKTIQAEGYITGGEQM